MSRNDYDDMGPSYRKRGRGNSKTFITAFMGVLVILIIIMICAVFSPSDESPSAADVPSVEIGNAGDADPKLPEEQDTSSSEIADSSSDLSIDDGIHFIRPSDGSVIFSFNELYDGTALDGTVFSSEPGSAVIASQDGTVSEVGVDSELGKYVIISHENGFRTYYYSLEMVNVKAEDAVSAGDVIATVGTSSRHFGEPALYFKIEKGNEMLDPMLFF